MAAKDQKDRAMRIEAYGQLRTITEWAEFLKLPRSMIANRIAKRWLPKDAVTRPPRYEGKRVKQAQQRKEW